jgi:hypothetical protein
VGFLEANIRFALARPGMKDKVADLIKGIAATL